MKKYLLTLSLFVAIPLFAQEAKRESIALTVYNNNLGVVRDVRLFDIAKGNSQIKLLDVPSQIDATTVKITAGKHPKDVGILEQNFEYDLVSQDKLLEKYIDKQISLTDDKGNKTEGTLLSSQNGQITLSSPTGILMFPNTNQYRISVPNLPEGLITRPTLIWNVSSNSSLTQEPLEVLYQTAGISWHAEYIAALADDDKSLDLTGWVSVDNRCGATFENAKLKLVAGKLNRATSPINYNRKSSTMMGGDALNPSFEERGLFEYHLGRSTTIKNNEVKQLSLLEADKVKSEKIYTYRGGRNAEVSIKFENTEKNNMGMPLPEGTVRVMKKDRDGSFEFVGEDHIQHTPRDEEITLKVGDAFDLIGERVVTDSKSLGDHSSKETIQITLKNRKDEDVVIDALENMGYNWEITNKSMDYEKKSANEVVFHVPVKARSEQKVEYTVLRTW
jgi:hypothetical protein